MTLTDYLGVLDKITMHAILHYAIPDISVIASVEAPNTLVTIINELIPRAV